MGHDLDQMVKSAWNIKTLIDLPYKTTIPFSTRLQQIYIHVFILARKINEGLQDISTPPPNQPMK